MNAFALALTSLLVGSAVAQSPTLGDPVEALPSHFRVPIHEHEPDPTFGRYGIWAAAASYKVSFHDGMTFYPVLGAEAPRNLPVAWQTTGVRFGEQDLPLGRVRESVAASDYRYEYRYASGVVEAYDVRTDGVEQLFRIPRPATPGAGGDLVVSGALSTDLVPHRETVGTSQAKILLRDASGRSIVEYGTAIAFDASGRRTDVMTELEGSMVRLRVPQSFVASATWPITIDPVLAAQTVTTLSGAVRATDVAHFRAGFVQPLCVAYSVAISSTDEDVYAFTTDADFQNANLVFSDIASFDSKTPRVAVAKTAGGPGRWMIALERASSTSQIRVWLHDVGNTTAQSGSMLFVPLSASGTTDRNPDIGGSVGNHGLVVYQTDVTSTQANTSSTELHYVLINANTPSMSSIDTVANGSSPFYDRENPSVSARAVSLNRDWIVTYQARTPALGAGNWSVRGQRIAAFGSKGTDTVLATSSTLPDLVHPEVDGTNYYYVVAALESSGTGWNVRATRFTWGITDVSPTIEWSEVVASVSTIPQSLNSLSIAFDSDTFSHWAIAFRRDSDVLEFVRLGFNGDVVDTATPVSGSTVIAPSICYDRTERHFSCINAIPILFGAAIVGRSWTYPDDAQRISYGSACGTASFLGGATRPFLGQANYRVGLVGVTGTQPAALLVGFAPAQIDLGVIGMTNCDLLVGGNPILTVPTLATSGGTNMFFDLTMAMDVYLQWAYVQPGTNPLSVQTTEGLKLQIR